MFSNTSVPRSSCGGLQFSTLHSQVPKQPKHLLQESLMAFNDMYMFLSRGSL